jgi:hypothetical protein
MVARAVVAAKFTFLVHSHMLRTSSPTTATTLAPSSRKLTDM